MEPLPGQLVLTLPAQAQAQAQADGSGGDLPAYLVALYSAHLAAADTLVRERQPTADWAVRRPKASEKSGATGWH